MEFWPPYTTPNEKPYAQKHVLVLEHALGLVQQFRTAIQAGGSVGYWPLRMARDFQRVITFEPEPMINECLRKNMADLSNVEVRSEALGAAAGHCDILRRGFGSHHTIPGNAIEMVALDSFRIADLDLLQLDIEGGELEALKGAEYTVDYCRPVIMVEILHPDTSPDLFHFLDGLGYEQVKKVGRDYVFTRK